MCLFVFCRPITGVCGFSRETLIAVTTDIESREQKYIKNVEEGLKAEHPRSSTTDDVECMFSIMRDLIGKNFTVKQVQYEWRKICGEFYKRMDPELPYYYHTSSHDRFYEGARPSFDEPNESKQNPRHQRISRKDHLGFLAPGRTSMPTTGAISTRMKFHNIPVELPPPPNTTRCAALLDHAYV